MSGQFNTTKNWDVPVTFLPPEFNLKKQRSWEFHADDRPESSSAYDMIIGKSLRSSWRVSHHHELQ
jgi:hypothetical protein